MNIDFTTELILRLFLAAFLGSCIGIEREYRAKVAGLRTHFLVAVGSALFMIISQFGFTEAILLIQNQAQALGASHIDVRADVSRVASQIVTGIGFIGAGTIILQKRFIVGLTTAACIWTTAAIGVAAAGGLYAVSIVATVLALAGLELFVLVDRKIGRSKHEIRVIFSAPDEASIRRATEELQKAGGTVVSYSCVQCGAVWRAVLRLDVPVSLAQPKPVLELLRSDPAITPEAVE